MNATGSLHLILNIEVFNYININEYSKYLFRNFSGEHVLITSGARIP